VGLNSSRYAYFVMLGPVDERRTYTPWFYSAVAMANALRRFESTADVVVLLVAATSRLTATEEALLRERGVRWRYASSPPAGMPGFHMCNYKLLAWEHTEYEVIQLLDADLLPKVNMDSFFQLPSDLSADCVSCPGRVSPLNAGWIALRPSARHSRRLRGLLERYKELRNDADPWGFPHLDSWLNSDGDWKPSGWKFFDATGNQGHLYAYFRFAARSLVVLVHATKVGGFVLVDYVGLDDPSRSPRSKPLPPSVAAHLESKFPCPFSTPKAQVPHAYVHFTSKFKPWLTFNPRNPKFLKWYLALIDHAPSPPAILEAVFPAGGVSSSSSRGDDDDQTGEKKKRLSLDGNALHQEILTSRTRLAERDKYRKQTRNRQDDPSAPAAQSMVATRRRRLLSLPR